jgi:flagellum-specific peptidoglycan hydrolase FlgJ
MLPLWKNLSPKKNKNTMSFDENKLISLMENFSGVKFQWIKTNRPEILGKVVTCRNIEPRGDRFFVMFDDGSSVDSTQLNTSLLMLHGDMQPLSRAEVESINGPKKPQVNPGQANSGRPQNQTITQPTQAQPSASNMFDMFNSEERKIDLQVSISLPDQDLLRMMYSNAKDKDKFLSELSDYVFRVINKTVVQTSISTMVMPHPPKQMNRTGTSVNITEIHED